MEITRIEPLKGQRCRLYLNDESAFCLKQEDVREYHLIEGEELPQLLYDQLCQEVLLKRAQLLCLEMLQRTDRTEHQLRMALQKKEYPPLVIDQAVAYVRAYHYIDDQHYAEHYIEQNRGKKTKAQMCVYLRGKGIASEKIEAALSRAGEPDNRQIVELWMRKKHFDPHTATLQEKERFIASLLRRGVPYHEVRQALAGD